VAVGRKLLSTFYAILKREVPYNPNWEVNCHFARQGVDINILIRLIYPFFAPDNPELGRDDVVPGTQTQVDRPS